MLLHSPIHWLVIWSKWADMVLIQNRGAFTTELVNLGHTQNLTVLMDLLSGLVVHVKLEGAFSAASCVPEPNQNYTFQRDGTRYSQTPLYVASAARAGHWLDKQDTLGWLPNKINKIFCLIVLYWERSLNWSHKNWTHELKRKIKEIVQYNISVVVALATFEDQNET